jgi:hypothetical protein
MTIERGQPARVVSIDPNRLDTWARQEAAAQGIDPTGISRSAIEDVYTRTAFHEAGHAVAHALAGRDIVRVSILPGHDELLGRVRTEPRWHSLQNREAVIEEVRELGVAMYAGVAAEHPDLDLHEHLRQPGRTGHETAPLGEWKGWDEVTDALIEHSENDREAFERTASDFGLRRPAGRWHWRSWDRAQRIVRRHRDAIERIAALLLEHEQIDGDTVYAMVDACSGASP